MARKLEYDQFVSIKCYEGGIRCAECEVWGAEWKVQSMNSEYRIVWFGPDGLRRVESGVWPTLAKAIEMATRSIRENAGWSSKYEVVEEPVNSNLGLRLDGLPNELPWSSMIQS